LNKRFVLALAMLVALPKGVSAGPVGPEFVVNTATTGDQVCPSVASLQDGGFVVTWVSNDQAPELDVKGQRYAADASPIGGEFIAGVTAGSYACPHVSGLNDGGFVVVWDAHINQANHIYGRVYQADGSSVGSAFGINSKRREIQRNPSVAGLLNGGFVVTWDAAALDGSYLGIAGRRYGVDGAPLAPEFQVNQYSANDQTLSALAPLEDGGFVGAWQSRDQDGWYWGVYGRRYDATGGNREFRVNKTISGEQVGVSVAGLQDGGYVITWLQLNGLNLYGPHTIFGQRYDAEGHRVGSRQFRVSITSGYYVYVQAAVAGLADGGFTVTWKEENTSSRISARRYDAAGTGVGHKFVVNTTPVGNYGRSFPAGLNDGSFVVVWEAADDGNGYGIRGQRFTK